MTTSINDLWKVSKHAQRYQEAFHLVKGDRPTTTITLSELSRSLGISSTAIRSAFQANESLPQGNKRTTGRKERFFTLSEAKSIREYFAKRNPILKTARPKDRPIPVIGVFAQKGGVKKSSFTANCCYYLTKHKNLKVLVLDLDGQGSLTAHLVTPSEYHSYNENETFAGYLENGNLKDIIKKDKYNEFISFVPSNTKLETLSLNFFTRYIESTSGRAVRDIRWGEDWWNLVPDAINEIKDDYDVVLIDSAPKLDLVNLSAIWATTHIYLPVPPKHGDIDSMINFMPPLLKSLERIERLSGKKKEFESVKHFISGLDKSKNAIMAGQINKIFPETITLTPIRQSDSVYANDQHFLTIAEEIGAGYAGSHSTLKALIDNYNDFFEEVYQNISKNWI